MGTTRTDSKEPVKGGRTNGWLALSPLAVFLVVYLVSSVMAGDFYSIPIASAFLIASCYAIAITPGQKGIEERIAIFSKGAGDRNVLLMIWIFVLAGAFASTAKDIGAIEATVNLTLRILPGNLLYAGIFIASCFISMSIGTSVGTIVALIPVTAGLAAETGTSAAFMAAIVTGGVIFYQCLVKKLKTGTFFRHTIIGKLVVYVYDAAKASRDVFWKVMGVCLGACILSATWFGIIPVLVCVFIFVPKWVNKYIALRKGIEEIAEGNIDYKIEITDDGELDRLSEKVNEISEAVSLAVDEELKSRQMKVDLISNVSHDLRTPLTSMITYIDLLKSEGLGSENAPEYLRIIDEKTVRLKKLTDDLFEAAKASSGAIPVNLEKIEMISIVNQALAEVGEKLDAAGLQILFDRKPEKAEVMADGQLLWRVIENLLTNAAKYAMPSSRVYIDIFEEEEGRVRLEIKNVSREPLNISADELTERFTRGDRSRNTEGSGLGLSIAKDLTGLMGGEFKIYIDGDLFKAAVILERA